MVFGALLAEAAVETSKFTKTVGSNGEQAKFISLDAEAGS